MSQSEHDRPGFLKRAALRLADVDRHLRGDRWRPLVRLLYRFLAPFYDWAADVTMPDYREATKRVLDEVNASGADRLLDLGCGTGMVTVPAAARVQFAVGIDMTPAMLRQARRKRQGSRPVLVRGDVRFLPFAAGAFTVLTTSFMLLHLSAEEKQQVFGEARRVLETGGRFGILTGREQTSRGYPEAGEWRDRLEAAGFDEVVVSEWGDAYRLVRARAANTA